MSRKAPLAFVIAHVAATPAAAEQASSAVIAVSVEVLSNCTVSASPIAIVARHSSDAATASDIAVRCGPEQPFTVALDQGRYGEGSLRRAYDAGGRRFLAYDIYSDPERKKTWGNRSDSTVQTVTDASGFARLKAYGALASGQALRPGRYADEVVVTVSF